VLALDVDPEVVPVAEGNAERNGVASRLRVAGGSVGDGWPFEEPAEASVDLVVANISAATLEALLPHIASALRAGGTFIGSGFIEEGATRVEAAVRAAGLEVTRVEAEGDWRCLVASKPG
jgi:ribosomal protein L11 methyltransferase